MGFNKLQTLKQTIIDREDRIRKLEQRLSKSKGELQVALNALMCHQEEFYPEDDTLFKKKDLHSENGTQVVLKGNSVKPEMILLTRENYAEEVEEGDTLYIKTLHNTPLDGEGYFTVTQVDNIGHEYPFYLQEVSDWVEVDFYIDVLYKVVK